MNFCVSNFADQHCLNAGVINFAIFPSQNLNLCECLCVCVCVSVRVCAYVYVWINVTSQNNVIVATCKTQHRVLFFEM